MNKELRNRESERGSAGVKFAITLAVIVLAANAAYNYIPAAYNSESLQGEMATAILQGMALPGRMNPLDNVKQRIQNAMRANDIPENAILDVKMQKNVITARVAYNKQINILPFGIYKYTYKFDHTATPTGLMAADAASQGATNTAKPSTSSL